MSDRSDRFLVQPGEMTVCAINPKHAKTFRLAFYTSVAMSAEQFERLVCERVLDLEALGNKRGDLRVHILEEEETHA